MYHQTVLFFLREFISLCGIKFVFLRQATTWSELLGSTFARPCKPLAPYSYKIMDRGQWKCLFVSKTRTSKKKSKELSHLTIYKALRISGGARVLNHQRQKMGVPASFFPSDVFPINGITASLQFWCFRHWSSCTSSLWCIATLRSWWLFTPQWVLTHGTGWEICLHPWNET